MWTLLPSERLRCWQTFRNDLDKLDLPTAIEKTNHLWSYAPYVKYYLTTDFIDKWPNPWELLYDNVYCDLAKALGIVYTLYLTEHCPELKIKIIKDPETGETFNTVWVNEGNSILNYSYDEVVNKKHLPKNLKLIRTITEEELSLQKLR